jgi:hypothetical protein
MGSTLRPQRISEQGGDKEPPELPLRWAVIILAAGVACAFIWPAGGSLAAAGLTVATVGLLHKILP